MEKSVLLLCALCMAVTAMPDAAPGSYTPHMIVQCADARISTIEPKCERGLIRIESVSLVKIDTPAGGFCDAPTDLPSDSKPCLADTKVLFRIAERTCTLSRTCKLWLSTNKVPASSRDQCLGQGQDVYVLEYQCLAQDKSIRWGFFSNTFVNQFTRPQGYMTTFVRFGSERSRVDAVDHTCIAEYTPDDSAQAPDTVKFNTEIYELASYDSKSGEVSCLYRLAIAPVTASADSPVVSECMTQSEPQAYTVLAVKTDGFSVRYDLTAEEGAGDNARYKVWMQLQVTDENDQPLTGKLKFSCKEPPPRPSGAQSEGQLVNYRR